MTHFERLLLMMVLKLDSRLGSSGCQCPECDNFLYTGYDKRGRERAEGHADFCLIGALTKDEEE